jgi:hypothetical protein
MSGTIPKNKSLEVDGTSYIIPPARQQTYHPSDKIRMLGIRKNLVQSSGEVIPRLLMLAQLSTLLDVSAEVMVGVIYKLERRWRGRSGCWLHHGVELSPSALLSCDAIQRVLSRIMVVPFRIGCCLKLQMR